MTTPHLDMKLYQMRHIFPKPAFVIADNSIITSSLPFSNFTVSIAAFPTSTSKLKKKTQPSLTIPN